MAQLKLWARVGVTMTLNVPDDFTETDIEQKFIEALNEHNPGKVVFHFDGESYIPFEELENYIGNIDDESNEIIVNI